MLKVSVVISIYNEERNIELCLEHLLKQEVLPYQIVLVDNASTDRSVEKIHLFIQSHAQLNIILLNETKRGVAAARNKGLSYADGEIIAFTDADCLARQDWIRRMIELYETEEIDGIGGLAYIYNPNTAIGKLEALELVIPRQMQKSVIATKYEPFLGKFIMGLNSSYKRKVFEQIGSLDEINSRPCGEDVDFSIRAFESGFKLMVWHPELVVWHMPRKNLRLYLKKIFLYSIALPLLFKKHFRKEMLVQMPIIGLKKIPCFTKIMITKKLVVCIFYLSLMLVFNKFLPVLLSVIVAFLLVKSLVIVFIKKKIIALKISFLELFKITFMDLIRKATWDYGKIYGSIKNRTIYL